MARVISCQTAAILVCVLAATALGKELIGREKRSEISKGLLAALGGVPSDGVTHRRSLTKDTRSVSDGSAISNTNSRGSGSGSGCVVVSGSSQSEGSSGQAGDFTWEIGGERDWAIPHNSDMMRSSGVRAGYSTWTTVCAQLLALIQFVFVLTAMP